MLFKYFQTGRHNNYKNVNNIRLDIFSIITTTITSAAAVTPAAAAAAALFVCLFGFSTSSSTTRLYRGRAPRQSDNFTCCHT